MPFRRLPAYPSYPQGALHGRFSAAFRLNNDTLQDALYWTFSGSDDLEHPAILAFAPLSAVRAAGESPQPSVISSEPGPSR